MAAKKLIIVSGKGGTGKTTFAGVFALLAAQSIGKLTIADCDVEASNLPIMLKAIKHSEKPFHAGFVSEIDLEKCTRCGLCRGKCRFDAIDANFRVDYVKCIGCGFCEYVCPQEAVGLKLKECGTIYQASTKQGEMVSAELIAGESASGKLVTEVRRLAEEVAEKNESKLLLVDGAPGIGCAVIASVTGATLALVVTEPTVSGIHDLERIIRVVRHFNIPVAVCVNKADLNRTNTGNIESFCRMNSIPFLGKVDYSPDIPRIQSQDMNLLEKADSKFIDSIKDIWSRLQDELERR